MHTAIQQPAVDKEGMQPRFASVEWTHDEVRAELGRILSSRFFVKSERLSCFLSTAVSYLLDGRADEFKEYTVGTEVYKRPVTYNPTEDSIVRTEARRLRCKLREYYESSAACSSIIIGMEAGSYVPSIQARASSVTLPSPDTGSPQFSGNNAVALGILPFGTTPEHQSYRFACELEAELTHEFSQLPGMRIFRTFGNTSPDLGEQLRMWSRSGVQFVLQGFLHSVVNENIAQIQLTSMSGMILCSFRLETGEGPVLGSNIARRVRDAVWKSSSLNIAEAIPTTGFRN
jgi:hypothetical protein